MAENTNSIPPPDSLTYSVLNNWHKQHKETLQYLQSSIASDQLLLRLLQGVKEYVEKNENDPERKYAAFAEKIEFTLDQKALERAVRKKYEDEDELDRFYNSLIDDEERPPYT